MFFFVVLTLNFKVQDFKFWTFSLFFWIFFSIVLVGLCFFKFHHCHFFKLQAPLLLQSICCYYSTTIPPPMVILFCCCCFIVTISSIIVVAFSNFRLYSSPLLLLWTSCYYYSLKFNIIVTLWTLCCCFMRMPLFSAPFGALNLTPMLFFSSSLLILFLASLLILCALC
jgi:hypothetical protein